MIVVLDNRDSFVFNLARHFELLGAATTVVPSHGTTTSEIARLEPRAIVISPGPCSPFEAGCSMDVVRAFRSRVPMLGVCLGHQAIAAALGARILRATEPMHGRTTAVHHDATDLFAGIPSPMTACRYHSLVVAADSVPAGCVVTARANDGTIMALADEPNAIYGVQFHPESILTRGGFRLLSNFLTRAGIPHHDRRAAVLDDDVAFQGGERPVDVPATNPPPVVTF